MSHRDRREWEMHRSLADSGAFSFAQLSCFLNGPAFPSFTNALCVAYSIRSCTGVQSERF